MDTYAPDLAIQYIENRDSYSETDKNLFDELTTVGVKDKFVVDVGCGGGKHASIILQMGAAEVLGVDINETMIAEAKKREKDTKKSLRFEVADGRKLPVADSSVDIIFSNFVIHYFEKTEEVFSEIARVLKPGGMFVGTFNMSDVSFGFEKLYNTAMPIRLGSGNHSLVVLNLIKSRDEIVDAIEVAGLDIVKMKELDHSTAAIDSEYEYKDQVQKHAMKLVLKKKLSASV